MQLPQEHVGRSADRRRGRHQSRRRRAGSSRYPPSGQARPCRSSRSTGCTSATTCWSPRSGSMGNGHKRPLGLVEEQPRIPRRAGADRQPDRALAVCRLFIVDGAKALSKAQSSPAGWRMRRPGASILEGLDEMLTVTALDCRESSGVRAPAPTRSRSIIHGDACFSYFNQI
jgi:hypothetical protein